VPDLQEVYMRSLFILSLLASFSVVACDRQDVREAREDAAEESREAVKDAREEGRETVRDLDAIGDNVAGRVPDADKDHEMFVGTVTSFTAGKTLSIQTADGDSKSFELDEKGTKVDVPKDIRKGAKVQVTVHRAGSEKTISVASQK
jgi:hypothetical protein